MSFLPLPGKFNGWGEWRNRNGGVHIQNRSCEKNYGKSIVKVSSTKCNGSNFEIISKELLIILYKKTFYDNHAEY